MTSKKTSTLLLICLYFSILMAFVVACSGGGGSASTPTTDNVVEQQGNTAPSPATETEFKAGIATLLIYDTSTITTKSGVILQKKSLQFFSKEDNISGTIVGLVKINGKKLLISKPPAAPTEFDDQINSFTEIAKKYFPEYHSIQQVYLRDEQLKTKIDNKNISSFIEFVDTKKRNLRHQIQRLLINQKRLLTSILL